MDSRMNSCCIFMNRKNFYIIISIIVLLAFVDGLAYYITKKSQSVGTVSPNTTYSLTAKNLSIPTPVSTNNSVGYGFFEDMHYPDLTNNPTANIQNPYLSGPVFHFPWAQLEPNKNQLDTKVLDNVLSLWSGRKKKIILLIKIASGGAEKNPWANSSTPKWVYAEGAKSVIVTVKGITQQIPLYWDPIFQQEYQRFLNLFARRYDGNPSIEFIIVGPGVFGTTRVVYPKDIKIFRKVGYTDQVWYEAIDKIQQLYQQAFHKTPLALGMGPFIGKNTIEDPKYNHWSIAQLAARRGFILYYHNLKGTSDWYSPVPVPPGASWNTYPEFFASFGSRVKIALGRDNPSSGRAQALEKYGDPVRAVKYAFGGIDGIPVINTYYIVFYEKDVAAGTTGDTNFQQRYKEAMQLAVQTWQAKTHLTSH